MSPHLTAVNVLAEIQLARIKALTVRGGSSVPPPPLRAKYVTWTPPSMRGKQQLHRSNRLARHRSLVQGALSWE